jgi:hypothetical protein
MLGMRFNAVPMAEDYRVFVHFVDANGVSQSSMNADHTPPTGTSVWSGAIDYSQAVSVPSTVAGGTYTIRVGLFQNHSPWDRVALQAGAGVTVDGELRYTVGTLTIGAPTPTPSPSSSSSPTPTTGIVGPTITTFTPSGPITLSSGQTVTGLQISNPNGPCINGVGVNNVHIYNNKS